MYKAIDLSGTWRFALDADKRRNIPAFDDTIELPGTTAYRKKGKVNSCAEIGCLTDEYKFEGYAWFSREIEISKPLVGKKGFLYLERTRVTTVFIDGKTIGMQNSLCTPHIYDVSDFMTEGSHTVTILVDNTDYPIKGGHLTSPDSQTNWIGITGEIELRVFEYAHIDEVQVYPDIKNKSVAVYIRLANADHGFITISAESYNGKDIHAPQEYKVSAGEMTLVYSLGRDALLWEEYDRNLYRLNVSLKIDGVISDTETVDFGMREFKSEDGKFTINGAPVFLRGKHDAMNFPRTGFAPTIVDEWLRVFSIAKSYGINHYRFHTCCPPEAAFTAADRIGVYLEPELPFWGTITEETDEKHNPAEQDFLLLEGFRILRRFGNHPSFVILSLGNELWGSGKRLNAFLKMYKEYDSRHLYTQGSNNFQFTPVILENDDFFCGVRLSKSRLIRGSYATCDAPLGHVQTDMPSTQKDYDDEILPPENIESPFPLSKNAPMIQVQVGTEAKTVRASTSKAPLIPSVPVVSHEIGQYAIYPDYREIEKYTGPLKAKNFEIFQQRLKDKGLLELAKKYFYCSGKLSVACYKEELEAAFRSRRLAGFQLLDLQDYSGQGTALVGVLDAFMDSKGLISPEEWRSFCADTVLLARFSKFNFSGGERFIAHVELCAYRKDALKPFVLDWSLQDGKMVYKQGKADVSEITRGNYLDICDVEFNMPDVAEMTKITLTLLIDEPSIQKSYDLWVYPKQIETFDFSRARLFKGYSDALEETLRNGGNAVLFARPETLKNAIEGFYCADFWCYPMFRSISKSMKKKEPAGTMGLLIDNRHPALEYFPSEEYATYPWWTIVRSSASVVLDETPEDFHIIVQIIDNFERNHRLGLLLECRVASGNLLVCNCDYDRISEQPEGRQFIHSILKYANSGKFHPDSTLSIPLKSFFKGDL